MKPPRFLAAAITLAALAGLALPPGAPAQQVEAPEHDNAAHHSHLDGHDVEGYLGVTARPLNADLRRHFGAPSDTGVLVATVEEGSPAAAAGLAVGDVVVAVDRHMVGSVWGLHREIRSRAGERVEIQVYRDGEARTLRATLGTRPSHHDHWDEKDWAQDWEQWGEQWSDWGDEWARDWAEWGAEFGERWAEFGAEMGERWGERGAEWGELGAEIGMRIAEAFADADWDEVDRAIEDSLRALERVQWDEIGDEVEWALEEVDKALAEALEEIDDEGGRERRAPPPD